MRESRFDFDRRRVVLTGTAFLGLAALPEKVAAATDAALAPAGDFLAATRKFLASLEPEKRSGDRCAAGHRDRQADQEARDDASMVMRREPVGEIEHDAGEEAGFGGTFYTFYGNALGAPDAIGEAGIGRVVAVADWLPNVQTAPSEAFYQAFRARFPKPSDDYVHMRMQLLVEALAQAIGSAEKTRCG